MRLIDADALRDEVLHDYTYDNDTVNYYLGWIDNAPTIDAAHGEWEPGNPICPVCGEDKFKGLDADIWSDWAPVFCPNCGAKMREKGE